MKLCDREGCKNEGTHHPVLILSPKDKPHIPASEFALGLVVCHRHQKLTTPADLIHPTEGFTVLDHLMQAMRGAPVDRENVGVVWRRVGTLPFPEKE